MGTLTAVGGTLSVAGGTLTGLGLDPADYLYLRGVNTQGLGGSQEDATKVPGTVETDYHLNSQAFYTYLGSRGHKLARIDFLWERVQSTFGGALRQTGLDELKTAVQRAKNAGMAVLLDMKNYGRYWLADDTQVMFGDGITAADFADVWGKLAVEFADEPAVVAYGLMNEPHDHPVHPDYTEEGATEFTPAATVNTFDATVEGWNGASTTMTVGSFPGMQGAGALTATRTLAAGNQLMQIQSPTSGGLKAYDFPAGSVIDFEVYVPTSTPGTIRVRNALITSGYAYAWNSFVNVPKGQIVNVRYTVPEAQLGTAHEHNVMEFAIDGSDGTTPTVVQLGQVRVGTVESVPANTITYWKEAAQAAVTAIRDTGDTRVISVAGDEYGAAWSWPTVNGDLHEWVVDPADNLWFECHQYFDDGGYYTQSYDQTEAAAVASSWPDLPTRVLDEFSRFTDWCNTNGVQGIIGEIGWPGDRDAAENAQWNALAEQVYDLLDANNIHATYWATGEWLQDADSSMYVMDAYNRGTQTPQAQTTVIEAAEHLSKLKPAP